MKCQQCSAAIAPGEEREHLGRLLCEDCFIDVLTPAKSCDPWAIYSAKSFEAHAGSAELTPLQSEILEILETTGGIEPAELFEKLSGKSPPAEVEKAFATLRHMEKVRAEKRDEIIYWRRW